MKWLFFILICVPCYVLAEDDSPPATLEDVEILPPRTETLLPDPNPNEPLADPQASNDDAGPPNTLGIDDPSLLLDVEQLPLLPDSGSFSTLKSQAITPSGAPSLASPALPGHPAPPSSAHSKPPPEVFATPVFMGPLPQKDTPDNKNGVVVNQGAVVNQTVPEKPRATASNDSSGPTAVDADNKIQVGPKPYASLNPFEASLKKPVPLSTPMMPLPGVPDVSVILANGQFYPSKIRLKGGVQTRLLFTTTGKKAAALMIEKLQIQRWIAREEERPPKGELERAKWEAAREVLPNKITEIVLDPMMGTYSFHDAVTGAAGEIIVE